MQADRCLEFQSAMAACNAVQVVFACDTRQLFDHADYVLVVLLVIGKSLGSVQLKLNQMPFSP